MKFLWTIILLILSSLILCQRPEDILKIARLVNDNFMTKYSDPTEVTNVGRERESNLWTRSVYYEGLMALNDVEPRTEYVNYSLVWADFHKWTPRFGTGTTDADSQCCAQTYMHLLKYIEPKKHMKQIEKVLENLNNQMNTKRHDYWTWIDAIQMAMPVFAKVTKLTGERKYLDYAMKSYHWTRDECGGGLFNLKNGFWWRDADFVPPYQEEDGKDCYWSRGNGWVYAALARVMEIIGKEDEYYNELAQDFILMSKAFASVQRDDGFWNVSLISPVTFGGKETSGTSLFLYGMSWGINNGILQENIYRPIVDRAWKGLEVHAVHPDGLLGYVQGTGKQPSDSQPVGYSIIPPFDDFGTGCFLLAAIEYYRLLLSTS